MTRPARALQRDDAVPTASQTLALARDLLRAGLAGRDPAVGPHLVRVDRAASGERGPLRDGLVVGRGSTSALRLAAAGVSRAHARVVEADGGFAIVDLGSKNGLAVNGRRVRGRAPLRDGDVVTLGGVVLRVETLGLGTAAPPTEPHREPAASAPPPKPRGGIAVALLGAGALLLAAASALAAS